MAVRCNFKKSKQVKAGLEEDFFGFENLKKCSPDDNNICELFLVFALSDNYMTNDSIFGQFDNVKYQYRSTVLKTGN